MLNRENKKLANCLLLVVLLFVEVRAYSQRDRNAKVAHLYSCLKEYDIKCPKTVLAIAIYETGWMECASCTYENNNLFGFRTTGDYFKFNSIYDCLAYFKKWQTAYYDPWKAKYPKGTYYDYLVHIKYAHINMDAYIKNIKAIEKLINKNVKELDAIMLAEQQLTKECNMAPRERFFCMKDAGRIQKK